MENSFFNSQAFKSQLPAAGRSPAARLVGLSDILSHWNQQRIASLRIAEAELLITDINVLRDIVSAEISRLKLNNPEVVSDQILFMFIGAIKLQIQQNSTKPWTVVRQSIRHFTAQEKSKTSLLSTLLFISLLVVFGTITKSHLAIKMPEKADVFMQENNTSAYESCDASISNLVNLYQKMKEGSCQLPQAAMLQPQDREAFITFINAGKVEIGTAANLKNALDYVHCLYPQTLMEKPLQSSELYR